MTSPISDAMRAYASNNKRGLRHVDEVPEYTSEGCGAVSKRRRVDTDLVTTSITNKAALASQSKHEMFTLKSGERELYSRSVDPEINAEGKIVDRESGYELLTDKGTLSFDTSKLSHTPTKKITLTGAVPRIVTEDECIRVPIEVVGQDGSACTANIKFNRLTMPNVFSVCIDRNGHDVEVGKAWFGADGKLIYPTTLDLSTVMFGSNFEMVSLADCSLDLSQLCMNGDQCRLAAKQDGRAAAAFEQLVSNEKGEIIARYQNGSQTILGKCELSRIQSPENMYSERAGTFSVTPDSGAANRIANPAKSLLTGCVMHSNPDNRLDYVERVKDLRDQTSIDRFLRETDRDILREVCRR